MIERPPPRSLNIDDAASQGGLSRESAGRAFNSLAAHLLGLQQPPFGEPRIISRTRTGALWITPGRTWFMQRARDLHLVLRYGVCRRDMTEADEVWVPEACTLPTVDQDLRLSEFDALFSTALRGRRGSRPRYLRWPFDPGVEDAARDLTARETQCCTFFTFSFMGGGEALLVDVTVPPAHVRVLDALASQATRRWRSHDVEDAQRRGGGGGGEPANVAVLRATRAAG
jgi:hypothetical protein